MDAQSRKCPKSRARPAMAAGAAVLLTALMRCAAPIPAPAPAPLPSPPAAPSSSAAQSFTAFIADFRTRALARGISAETYDAATAGLKPIPQIQALYEEQPEFAKPVWEYLDTAVSPRRVSEARALLASDADLLGKIETESGVPAAILVAIWGMESDYGRDTGGFNLFGALATLAYDGPLQNYARPEFLAALQIMQAQHYAPAAMTGSWAGAFGQTQFTPTTFLRFATDGDGDGRIDLWHSPADALASAARLLADAGWERGKAWGMEVLLPPDFPYEQADLDTVKPQAAWSALGVKAADGAALASSDEDGAIYLPAGMRGPAFLVLGNFKVILKYNNAASYALAVCLLAERAQNGGTLVAQWPRDERALSRAERLQLQSDLKTLGFDPGAIDGVIGRGTRAALRLYQKSRALAADGYATSGLLRQLHVQAMAVPAGG